MATLLGHETRTSEGNATAVSLPITFFSAFRVSFWFPCLPGGCGEISAFPGGY